MEERLIINNTERIGHKYMVATRCYTFNHSHYIEDTLNGFLIQETQYPSVFCIVDDASTDDAQVIIRKWADINLALDEREYAYHKQMEFGELFFAHGKRQKNVDYVIVLLKDNHYQRGQTKLPYIAKWIDSSKYIALCEGDDYWICHDKLQTEIEILEKNEHITLVHTAFNFVNERGEIIGAPESLYDSITRMKKDGYLWQNHLVLGTPILYCTIMYRQGFLDKEGPTVDYAQFMSCARKGEIAYIKEPMSAYRILTTSMMRTQRGSVNSRIKSGIFWQLYFFSRRQYATDDYYKRNLRTRVLVSEAIINALLKWDQLFVEYKYKKLFYILFSRPLNTILLPLAVVMKIKRKIFSK